jgi:hypothetical protein
MSKNAGKKQPFKDAVRVEAFTRLCRVELTHLELADKADRAAHVLRERDGKEADRKAANTAAKSQIEELEAELRKLSGEVRDKATYKPVECERTYDFRIGTVREVRNDTREVLHQHAMTDAERQLPLALDNVAKEADELGKVAADNDPPLPTQKRGKPKQGKGRRAPRAGARA